MNHSDNLFNYKPAPQTFICPICNNVKQICQSHYGLYVTTFDLGLEKCPLHDFFFNIDFTHNFKSPENMLLYIHSAITDKSIYTIIALQDF